MKPSVSKITTMASIHQRSHLRLGWNAVSKTVGGVTTNYVYDVSVDEPAPARASVEARLGACPRCGCGL
jgi:hypothetical protein